MPDKIEYQIGLPETLRNEAAQLYDEAFGAKFAIAVPNQAQRLHLLADSFCLPFAVGAIAHGRLVGLAGFQTPQGALTKRMTAAKLFQHFNIFRATWAAMVFSLYERKSENAELLMDGIAVAQDLRGQGIGTKLLNELKKYAHDNGFLQIRLDVIDTNLAARRLYAHQGFVAKKTESFSYLRPLLGFGASTTMVFPVEQSG